MQELIEAPLSRDDLAARYRALCDDPCYANVPGKIELDLWGRMVMSPASDEFMRVHGFETPYTRSPELCIEVVSPSNSRKELREEVAAYLDAGATEVWIVFPQSRRIEFHGPEGLLARSQYVVDLADIFR
jgi:hypothetical protein